MTAVGRASDDARLLAATRFWRGTSIEQLEELLRQGRRRTLPRDGLVGGRDLEGAILVVAAGEVRALDDSASGRRLLLRAMCAGEAADARDEGWLDREALVQAGEVGSVIYLLSVATFDGFLRREGGPAGPRWFHHLERTRGAGQRRLAELAFFQRSEQLGHELARQAHRAERDVVRATERELGEAIGAEQGNVAHYLQKLELDGLVERSPDDCHSVRIVDLGRLERVGGVCSD